MYINRYKSYYKFYEFKFVIYCFKIFFFRIFISYVKLVKWFLKMYSRSMLVCIKVLSENIYYMYWKKNCLFIECYLFM